MARAKVAFDELGLDVFGELSDEDMAFLRLNIEKRHVVGHNLSIADENYAEATRKKPGCTVEILAEEVTRFAVICERVVSASTPL